MFMIEEYSAVFGWERQTFCGEHMSFRTLEEAVTEAQSQQEDNRPLRVVELTPTVQWDNGLLGDEIAYLRRYIDKLQDEIDMGRFSAQG